MAVAHTGTPTSAIGTAAASLVFSITVPSDSTMLVVATGAGDELGASSSTACVFNTTETCTQITGSPVTDGVFCQAEGWYRLMPSVTTANVTVTFTVGTDELAAIAFNLSGVHQTTTFDTAATATGSGTTISVAVGSAVGDMVIGATFTDDETIGAATGTLILESGPIAADAEFAAQYYDGAASVTVQWAQDTSTGWAVWGISVNPAAGGAAGAMPRGSSMLTLGVG